MSDNISDPHLEVLMAIKEDVGSIKADLGTVKLSLPALGERVRVVEATQQRQAGAMKAYGIVGTVFASITAAAAAYFGSKR